MPDVVKLSCPSCGGKLEITADIDRFACGYCGLEQIVKRSGGIVTLSPVVDAIRKVELGVDKTASELAIIRLKSELTELILERDAFVTKSPKPAMGFLHVAFLLGGGILFLFGVMDFLANLKGGILVIGFIVLVAGIVMYISNKGAIRIWNNEIFPVIQKFDNKIEQKQIEMQRHHDMVSQK